MLCGHLLVFGHGASSEVLQALLYITHAGAVDMPEAQHDPASATGNECADVVALHALAQLVHVVQRDMPTRCKAVHVGNLQRLLQPAATHVDISCKLAVERFQRKALAVKRVKGQQLPLLRICAGTRLVMCTPDSALTAATSASCSCCPAAA
jgi:hypothetical protein